MRPRSIVLFSVQFVLLFAVFLGVYRVVISPYHKAVVVCSNAILRNLNPPMHIKITSGGGEDYFLDAPGGEAFDAGVGDLSLAYLNLALLPALLLATPIGIVRRMRLCGAGLLWLVTLHVALSVMIVRVMLCHHFSPEHFVCNLLMVMFATGGQVFGVALWGLLTWRYFLPGAAAERLDPGPRSAGRNLPCACGSGRKAKHCCARSG